jgi:uncharacterized protein YndB with AHSA1/START domain
MSQTVRLHRVFAAPVEKLFRAFTDPHALARWIPPDGFYCVVDHFEAKAAGTFRMSFVNFTTEQSIHFGGEYKEYVKNEKLRYTDVFDDPNLPGEMMVTVIFKSVSVGSEVHITQEHIPAIIPVEACYLGWQQSLNYLAKLVEPNIA